MKQIGLNKHKHLIDYRSTSHPIKPLTFLTNPLFFFFWTKQNIPQVLSQKYRNYPRG